MVHRTAHPHGTFSWVDFAAHDMDAAAKFYGDLFGWTMEVASEHGGPRYGMFRLADDVVAGIGELTEEMRSTMPPVWNSYVSVDDIDAITAKVEAAGGKVVVPKQGAGDSGSLAYYADPSGAVFAVWQPQTHVGAARVNDPGCFCWNELLSSGVEASTAFYGEVFGWTATTDSGTPPYTMLRNGEEMNGGVIPIDPSWGPVPPHWGVYFAVEDIEAAVARVTELGGKTIVPIMAAPEVGRFAKVADPQGGAFSLIQMRATDGD